MNIWQAFLTRVKVSQELNRANNRTPAFAKATAGAASWRLPAGGLAKAVRHLVGRSLGEGRRFSGDGRAANLNFSLAERLQP